MVRCALALLGWAGLGGAMQSRQMLRKIVSYQNSRAADRVKRNIQTLRVSVLRKQPLKALPGFAGRGAEDLLIMAKAVKKKTDEVIEVQEIVMRDFRANLLGASPMIMNRFAFKAWQELLLPSKRENRASLEQSLKHDPFSEFRGAMYLNRDSKRPTLIHLPTGAIHGALSSAALDMPGAAKAKIERLTKVVDLQVDLYGTPHIFCAMVRNSDIGRTPDVRTRPIFPEWCLTVTLRYAAALVTERTVANLLSAAGLLIGIGDWRGQKGGPYGAFQLVGDGDARFQQVKKMHGRAAQQKAFDTPIFYDADTEELLTWFEGEVRRREMEGQLGRKGVRGAAAMPKTKVFIEKGANGRKGDGEFVSAE